MSTSAPALAIAKGGTAPRKRGRRAGISKDAVIQAALDIVRIDPTVPVSLNAIARALGVTPMAIYTYFANRDEVMQALTAALLDGIVIVIPANAAPDQKIRAWSHAMRDYFLTRPQLIMMLSWGNGHSSVAWLNQSRTLIEALESLGLGGQQLGRGVLWIWNLVMGAIHAELVERENIALMPDDEIERLDPTVARGVRLIHDVKASPDHHGKFFNFQVERMIDGLVLWIDGPR